MAMRRHWQLWNYDYNHITFVSSWTGTRQDQNGIGFP